MTKRERNYCINFWPFGIQGQNWLLHPGKKKKKNPITG